MVLRLQAWELSTWRLLTWGLWAFLWVDENLLLENYEIYVDRYLHVCEGVKA